MRITVRQHGGFAGMAVDLAQIDTGTLDPPTRTALEQQVRAVLSARDDPPQIGADLLQYELAVEEGGSRNSRTSVEGTEAAHQIRELAARIADVR